MNNPTTPPLVYESVREFLSRHTPFSSMQDEALAFLIARLKLSYFPAGSVIVHRDHPGFVPLFIIQNGAVSSQTAGLDTLPDRLLSPGECFPVGALSAGGKPTRTYRAVDDVFAYELALTDFEQLRKLSSEFAAFCGEAVTMLAQQSLAELQRHYSQVAADQHSLTRPLGELIRREAVTCPVDATLRAAVTTMREQAVRSIILIDAQNQVQGIMTLNDLRDRVVLEQVALDTPVAQVATADPTTLPASATAADAIQLMAASGIHQVIITERGRVRGIVSERDLFVLQRVSLRQVHHALRSARDVAALTRVAGDIHNLMGNLLAQGVAAEALTRTIASLNDSLTRQAIALALQNHRALDVPWCWLALGSEGRGEQTLATDQDNALVFALPSPAASTAVPITAPIHAPPAQADAHGHGDAPRERVRKRLLAFAREVNDALATLGFPLCTGGIMASNPAWCLSAEEWREQFTGWLTEPTPPALLNANIFFDLRPIAGDAALAENLQQWLLARTQDNRLFLRLMVANALQTEAPLGLIRAFVTDDEPGREGTLDLKVRGTRIFTDAARVFALAQGLSETGTAERLRRAGAALGVPAPHVGATVDGFHFLQMLRLRTQEQAGGVRSNRIDPFALNEIDQRMLKEAFRQARKVQQRLRDTYAAF